jgi:Matrixin
MLLRRIIGLALVVASFLLWSATARAFCRTTTCKSACGTDTNHCPTGAPVRWESSCVGVSVDGRGSALLDRPEIDGALQDAMGAWNDVDCGDGKPPSVQLMQLADVDCGHASYAKHGPNANVLHFRDESWDDAKSQDEIALTTLTFGTSSADIRDGDIAINTANKRIGLVGDVHGTFDLRAVLTHELGHLLGIGHSTSKKATMYAGVETGDTSPRSLSADDIAAICAIYPPDDVLACASEPEGGLGGCENPNPPPPTPRCSVTPSVPVTSNGSVHCLALLAIALLGILRRR